MYWTDINIVLFLLPLLLLLIGVQYMKRSSIICRNLILLITSCLFYYFLSSTFIFILFYVIIINYVAGILLIKKNKKSICVISTILSLLPLIFFKYVNFISTEVLQLGINKLGELALPIGISFFTFQALTYTIDIYRGKIQKESSLLNYALFVCFFPTIMSGPIEKARNLLGQINGRTLITPQGVISGFQLFMWGLFKKVVVADSISGYVNMFYYSTDSYTGNSYLFAILLYSLQIYCDFSGYSDMSIGIARSIGFKLGDNFKFPYFSTTIGQFWKRWHISLTSWFTENLYITCGGNRVVKWRWIVNISLVFIVSGLWHGAAWTFIIWGALHAILYLSEHYIKLRSENLNLPRRLLQIFYVYIMVSLAWVFFRATSFENAVNVIAGVFRPWGSLYMGSSTMSFVIMILVLVIFSAFDILIFLRKINIYDEASCVNWSNQLTTVSLLLVVSLFGHSGASFVYTQF